jgi:thioredoxin-related protein
MRKFPLAIIAAWSATLTFTLAAMDGWTSDWQAAKERSKHEGKPIFMYLTGSDWCGWCKKLEKEVISQQSFMDFAKRHFVLMEVDLPRKKQQPPELKKQNAELEKKYLAGGYPTIWVLDSEGNKLSKDLGEVEGGVDGYIARLKEFIPAANASTRAFIDDSAPGFRDLTAADFAKVNSADDTWSWKDGVLHCTGQPVSVMRSVKPYANFELVVEWMHEKPAGNSGVFVWTTPASIEKLAAAGKPGLPDGIEVQILDHAFTDQMKAAGKATDWFGTHGDVFPVRVKMKPFPPLSPNGERSFPRKQLAKGHGEWNHYYIRAINGEVRLWVNGEEVSGGNGCDPASGYLCLESEGSPIQFRKLRIRELP